MLVAAGGQLPGQESKSWLQVPTAAAHRSRYLPWLLSEHKPPVQQLQPSFPPFSLPEKEENQLCQASGPEEDKGIKGQYAFQKYEKHSEGHNRILRYPSYSIPVTAARALPGFREAPPMK